MYLYGDRKFVCLRFSSVSWKGVPSTKEKRICGSVNLFIFLLWLYVCKYDVCKRIVHFPLVLAVTTCWSSPLWHPTIEWLSIVLLHTLVLTIMSTNQARQWWSTRLPTLECKFVQFRGCMCILDILIDMQWCWWYWWWWWWWWWWLLWWCDSNSCMMRW